MRVDSSDGGHSRDVEVPMRVDSSDGGHSRDVEVPMRVYSSDGGHTRADRCTTLSAPTATST